MPHTTKQRLPSPARLRNVLWLGGSPCAGKTSVARILAELYALPVVHTDESFNAHRERFDLQHHPTLCKWTRNPWDDLWNQPADVLLQENIAGYAEHFLLILEDLLAAEPQGAVLVEGSSLLPGSVAPWLAKPRQAIWFAASEAFQRTHYPHRGTWVEAILQQCQVPEDAFARWMDRDVAFARWVAGETERLGLEMIWVEGQYSIADNAARVAQHMRLARRGRDAQSR